MENEGIVNDFSEELKKNVVEYEISGLSSKDIVFQILEGQGLNEQYKTNERAVDEIVNICEDVIKKRLGDDISFDNVESIDKIKTVLTEVVSKDGRFEATTERYRRQDNIGTLDNVDYREQVGKTVKRISIPDKNGNFSMATDKLGYISNKGTPVIGTETYHREIENINKDGVVMKKVVASAIRKDRDALAGSNGIQPRFEGVGEYENITSMERIGDSILVNKKNFNNDVALMTRNDTRYNESDINVPFQAIDILDAKLKGVDESEIKAMYDSLSPYYKTEVDPGMRQAQREDTAERISKDPYGKGLKNYYMAKAGYRESDFNQNLELE